MQMTTFLWFQTLQWTQGTIHLFHGVSTWNISITQYKKRKRKLSLSPSFKKCGHLQVLKNQISVLSKEQSLCRISIIQKHFCDFCMWWNLLMIQQKGCVRSQQLVWYAKSSFTLNFGCKGINSVFVDWQLFFGLTKSLLDNISLLVSGHDC